MSTVNRVPSAELTGVAGLVIKTMARRMLGEVPEASKVMWNNPRVFKDMMGFGRAVSKWGALDPGLASLAEMAAASEIGCSFCLDLGYFMAHNEGLDEAKAREVPVWRSSTSFTEVERRVMEYAEAMCQMPPSVGDDVAEFLLDELGAPAVIELAARVGWTNSTARSNLALGIRSQGFAEACGLPPMSAPSGSK